MRKAVVVIATLLILFTILGVVVIDQWNAPRTNERKRDVLTPILSKDNVTVSGKALVSGAVVLAATIQKIEFTDTQTGTTTTISHFTFAPQTTDEGNYSVTLKNGHTYNVYIIYSVFNPDNMETQFITTFTVNATAGQTAITKNFTYPNQT
jgi:hypothetical protein